MLLRTKGIPVNIDQPIVGRITRDRDYKGEHAILICEEDLPSATADFACVLTNLDQLGQSGSQRAVYKVPSFDHLKEGDLVVAGRDGNIKTLYRVNSFHNTLLATERCNSNCLMCSQPPKDRDDIPALYSVYEQLIPLIPKDCFELC